jgi:hypothetical protein
LFWRAISRRSFLPQRLPPTIIRRCDVELTRRLQVVNVQPAEYNVSAGSGRAHAQLQPVREGHWIGQYRICPLVEMALTSLTAKARNATPAEEYVLPE